MYILELMERRIVCGSIPRVKQIPILESTTCAASTDGRPMGAPHSQPWRRIGANGTHKLRIFLLTGHP